MQGTSGSPWKDFVGIKGVQSYTNFFIGVQGEPGHGKYFDLDNVCYENNIFGHNNWSEGPKSEDPFLVYINSGSAASFAGVQTEKLTASTVTCSGGSKNVTDLCAIAREVELHRSVGAGSTREALGYAASRSFSEQVREQERNEMRQELIGLRAEVARLTELVQALSKL